MTKQRKLLNSLFWISTLLAYLSFSPASMPMMPMNNMDSQMAHHASGNYMAVPCCETIGTFCFSLALHSCEITNFSFVRGKNQIEKTDVLTKSIFLEILLPPPKA